MEEPYCKLTTSGLTRMEHTTSSLSTECHFSIENFGISNFTNGAGTYISADA